MRSLKKLARAFVESAYYWSARLMPMRIDDWTGGTWAGTYVMTARFYFEFRDEGILSGWPWNFEVIQPPEHADKPFTLARMSVAELRAEHAYWDTIIRNASHWGAALAEADQFRKAASDEMARRGEQP